MGKQGGIRMDSGAFAGDSLLVLIAIGSAFCAIMLILAIMLPIFVLRIRRETIEISKKLDMVIQLLKVRRKKTAAKALKAKARHAELDRQAEERFTF